MEPELKSIKEHYIEGVMLALAGYQLIEASLKTYLKNYFSVVKHIVPEELHFGFDGNDYENAALGTLVKVFAKVCGDRSLVSDLKSEISHRDRIAHRGMLVLYKKESLDDEQYSELSNEVALQNEKITDILKRLGKVRDDLVKNYGQ